MFSEGSVYATSAMNMNLDVVVDQDATAGGKDMGKSKLINKWLGELYDRFAGESYEELLSNAELQYNDVEEEDDHGEKHWNSSHNLDSTNRKVETGLEHHSLPRVPIPFDKSSFIDICKMLFKSFWPTQTSLPPQFQS